MYRFPSSKPPTALPTFIQTPHNTCHPAHVPSCAPENVQGSQLQAPDGSAHVFFDNSHLTYDDDNDSQPSLPNFTLLQPPSFLSSSSSPRDSRGPPESRVRPSEDNEQPSFQ
eukprot:scaffold26353_cov19-Tisochrysis_lutea.AAC.1